MRDRDDRNLRLRRTLLAAVAALGVCALCSGCGGGTNPAAATTPGSGARAGSPSAAHPGGTRGKSASELAGRIGGCTGVTSLSTSALHGAAPALRSARLPAGLATSVATCRIEGHPLVVFAVATLHDQAALEKLLSGHVGYYSAGPGWVAAPATDLGPTPEMSLTQAAAQSLGGSVLAGTAGR